MSAPSLKVTRVLGMDVGVTRYRPAGPPPCQVAVSLEEARLSSVPGTWAGQHPGTYLATDPHPSPPVTVKPKVSSLFA